LVGDSDCGSDGSTMVSVSDWAKFMGSTIEGWLGGDDVEMFADTDPAGSSVPSASAGAMFRGSTTGGWGGWLAGSFAQMSTLIWDISPILLRTDGYNGSNGSSLAFCFCLVVGERLLYSLFRGTSSRSDESEVEVEVPDSISITLAECGESGLSLVAVTPQFII